MSAVRPMEKMFAEWQIRGATELYARGADRRDGDIIASIFHPGAMTHYGDFDGTVETFVPWVLDYVERYSTTMHFMGRTIIDWPGDTGDHAVAETYAAVLHEVGDGKPGRSWVGGIRYIDRFEPSADPSGAQKEWRIRERTVVGDWLRIDPAANHRQFSASMLTGQTAGADPLFTILSAIN